MHGAKGTAAWLLCGNPNARAGSQHCGRWDYQSSQHVPCGTGPGAVKAHAACCAGCITSDAELTCAARVLLRVAGPLWYMPAVQQECIGRGGAAHSADHEPDSGSQQNRGMRQPTHHVQPWSQGDDIVNATRSMGLNSSGSI